MKALLRISEQIGNFRFWRLVVNFWTGVFFVAIVYDFASHNAFAQSDIMIAIAAIYCASLAIYSAEKEFRRWHHLHDSLHPGEFYVILWTLFIIALFSAQAFFGRDYHYHMPAEVSTSYIAVLSILALTRESKNMYKRKRRG